MRCLIRLIHLRLSEGSSKNLEDLVDAQAIEDAMVSIGELGWVDPDETPPEVKRALDTARDGDTPVACPTPVGLLVMQVTESRYGGGICVVLGYGTQWEMGWLA